MAYEPIVDEYVVAIYDKRLLIPKVDYFIDGADFIFATAPANGRFLSLHSIEAPVPSSFGSGAEGFARVNDLGQLTSISTNVNGSNYRFEYPPKVSISTTVGSGGAAQALVNGIKTVTLNGGKGYSDTNPPVVQIESPTKTGSIQATLKATVENGSVTAVELQGSGSG